MKVGLLSDIHGNDLALEAVLNAAKQKGVEELLIAGDFVGYYYNPERVLELLNSWSWNAVGGNHEAMLGEWLSGNKREEILKKYGSGIKNACSKLTEELLEKLIALPQTRRIELCNRNVLLCHGSPWDKDCYIYPDAKMEIRNRFFEEGSDLVVYGHTHYPVVWQEGEQLVVNPGSVGQPRDRKPGACWALWDTEEHKIALMRENYDFLPLIEECKRIDPQLLYLVDVLTRS